MSTLANSFPECAREVSIPTSDAVLRDVPCATKRSDSRTLRSNVSAELHVLETMVDPATFPQQPDQTANA